MKKEDMNRRQIRYLLFRLRTKEERGVKPPPLPTGFKKIFEEQEHFGGWETFGIAWDVTESDPWVVYPRDRSLLQEWHELLLEKVPVLPHMILQPGTEEKGKKDGRQSHLRPVN